MAFDPSLISSQSDSSVLRSDHHTAHTPLTIHSNRDNSSLPISQSTTSPTVRTPQSQAFFMDSPQLKDDHPLNQPSISPISAQNGPSITDEDSQVAPSAGMTPLEVDPQIIEALKGKDRIYVLKLGETFEALITERRTRVELSAATSYQRLLVHRCSAYYRLTPESDPVTKGIFVLSTTESRIPDRRISELVPAEATTQPAFKIMRRSVLERRSKPQSHGGSVAGEDADLSDVEPSEAGSIGGRSINSASTKKHRMTIEEREAAYNEARSRIFMDFEEKEKSKEKDMSASSSSLSLTGSASTSAGGRSNISDTDDAASSPATESEWSVPSASHSRDKKDNRRGHPNGSASSNRPLRNGGSFHANGSGGSSRNSRAPSPSFSYASLHDASPAGHIYDPSHHQGMYYPNQYTYPYSPPAQGPGPYMNPYPYYSAPYNPYPHPNPQHGASDPSATPGPESFPPQQMNYAPHFGWPQPPPPPIQSPPHGMHMPLSPHPPPPQNQAPLMSPPPSVHPQPPHYPPFPPPHHAYPYAMNPYYPSQQPPPPPSGQQMQPSHINMNLQHPQTQAHQPPPQQQQQQPAGYDVPRVMNGNQIGHPSNGPQFINQNGSGSRPGLGNGIIPPNNNNGRVQSRNGIGHANAINSPKNGAQMPPPGRSAWSYGPGVGNGGHTTHSHAGEALGPRFQSPRHASGNSSSGGNSRSSICDDATSTSSSTTSSSSRRTYTSTTSSQQHPLPARPDWAVGLRAQPTLAGGRHLDHSRNISPISPPRSSSNGNNSPLPLSNGNSPRNGPNVSQHTPSVSLQSTDFPPLTSTGGGPAAEKKTPVVTGAWGQSRPILSPATNGHVNTSNPGSVQLSPIVKQEDGIMAKPGEVINPKLVRRPQQNATINGQNVGNQRAQSDRNKDVGATNKNDVSALAGQVSSMTINGDGNGGGFDASALSAALNDAANSSALTSGATSAAAPTTAA